MALAISTANCGVNAASDARNSIAIHTVSYSTMAWPAPLVIGALPLQPRHQRQEGAGRRHLSGFGEHFVDADFIFHRPLRISHHQTGESDDHGAGDPQQFFLAHAVIHHELLDDVFRDGDGRRKQGAGGGGDISEKSPVLTSP
jgi:hypothetical protein